MYTFQDTIFRVYKGIFTKIQSKIGYWTIFAPISHWKDQILGTLGSGGMPPVPLTIPMAYVKHEGELSFYF